MLIGVFQKLLRIFEDLSFSQNPEYEKYINILIESVEAPLNWLMDWNISIKDYDYKLLKHLEYFNTILPVSLRRE